MRGDDKVVPAMVELCKKRANGVENFDYMIGHTNIQQPRSGKGLPQGLWQGSAGGV